MISLDGGDKGGPRNGELRKATPSDIRDRAGKSTFSLSAGVVSHPADSTQSTSSSLTSLDTVITLPQPPLDLPFVSLTSPTIPNDSTPVLAARSLCALAGSGPSEHTYNPHHPQKRITSRLKTSRSAEAFSSSASLSSSPAEVDINGGILRQASTTSYSSTCSTCSSGLDQTDSRRNSCSSITIGSTSNSCTSQSPSSASKENLSSSCCSSSASSLLPPATASPPSSSPPPIGAFESAPLATIAATTATTFSPCFVPVCTAFSGLPACSHRTARSPSPRRESPISVTATEADSSLRQSVGVCMENPVVLETPCHRYSCCRCCSWFTAPEPVVLVACGSFNPITTMHLRLMELARDAIEKTWSFPTQSSSGDAGSTSSDEPIDPARELCQAYLTRPPKRQIVVAGIFSPVSDAYAKAGLAPVESRCRLARLACATTSDWLAVDTWEASQPGWSPTRVVFEHLQARLNRLAELSSEEVDNLLAKGPSPARPETVSPTREKNKPVPQTVDSSDELPGIASDAWLCERLLDAQTLAGQSGSLRPCRCFLKEEHASEAPQAGEAGGSTGEPSASGRLPRARVKLVCGADLLQSFATPGLWSEEDMETLARDFGIICISRPESNAARLLNELDVLAKYEQNVILVTEWCQNGLSATLVRRALARGQSVRYLVPDAALEEIYAAGLYGARRRRLENPPGTGSAARRPRLSRHAADCSFRLEPRPDGQVSQEEEKIASKEEAQEKSVSIQPGKEEEKKSVPLEAGTTSTWDPSTVSPVLTSPDQQPSVTPMSTMTTIATTTTPTPLAKKPNPSKRQVRLRNHSAQTRLAAIPTNRASVLLRRVILDPKMATSLKPGLEGKPTAEPGADMTAILPLLKQCSRCGSQRVRLLLIERYPEPGPADQTPERPSSRPLLRRHAKRTLSGEVLEMPRRSASVKRESRRSARFHTQPICPPLAQNNVAQGNRVQTLADSKRISAVESQAKSQRATLYGGQPCLCHRAASSMESKQQHTCDREFWDTPTISLRQARPRDQVPVRPLLRGAMQYLQTAHSGRPSSATGTLSQPDPAHAHSKQHWRGGKKTSQKTRSRETAQTHHEAADNVRQEALSRRSSQVPRGPRDRRIVACGSKDEADRVRSSRAILATSKTTPSNPSTPTTRANVGRYGHNYDEVDVLLYNLCLNIESAL